MQAVARITVAGLVLGALLVALPGPAAAQSAQRKVGRGLANMTCGFLELPGNMVREGRKSGAPGVALGFAKGLGGIVVRELVGVYEFVTAPFPWPAGYKPYLDSSRKLILLSDGCGAEGPTAVVSPASIRGALGLRAMMESRARGANR